VGIHTQLPDSQRKTEQGRSNSAADAFQSESSTIVSSEDFFWATCFNKLGEDPRLSAHHASGSCRGVWAI